MIVVGSRPGAGRAAASKAACGGLKSETPVPILIAPPANGAGEGAVANAAR